MIGYTCKYTPIELLEALGGECVLINSQTTSFSAAESEGHSNLCCHCKALLEHCLAGVIREFVFVNCCDSVRRIYDIVKEKGDYDFIFLLDLPRTGGTCSVNRFKDEILRLYREYSAYKGTSFSPEKFYAAFKDDSMYPNGEFIALTGARVSRETKKIIEENSVYPIADLTCSGNRSLFLMERYDTFEEEAYEYAHALLTQIPCMRMADVSSRKALAIHPNIKGIIYHTVKFCDYYSFEYENLRKESTLPMLKIETDFTPLSSGQLSTRLEAFCEEFEVKNVKKNKKDSSAQLSGALYAGIDSGSTSTNVVVIDESGKTVASAIVRTGPRAEMGAKRAFEKIEEEYGIKIDSIKKIIATGYGRNNIGFAHGAKTEITCHGRGANFINPNVRTVIDIGGQDSKVICLDGNGNVTNFVMNDKCAAGTGRFLEAMAKTLELELEEMGKRGLSWKENITISSMCTVFAESEVISLIAENKSSDDIIHGLNKSVASKTLSLVARTNHTPVYMMTGGVARNKGVAAEIEKGLNDKLFIPENPDLCGALGAALFALDSDNQ